jgi:ketosteroid isomerase-like protein
MPLSSPTEDEEAIRAVVEAVFKAMYAGDAEALGPLFHPDALLRIVEEGEIRQQPAAAFIAQVGTPREDPLDERFADLDVRIDGPLATAWMAYTLYIGESFSHCGVNAMRFIRTADAWQVLGVSYTRRTSDCLADL